MTGTERESGGQTPLPPDICARVNDRLRGTFAGLLGMEVTNISRERVQARLRVRSDLLQSRGILHGGALMTLADTVAGIGAHFNAPPGSPGVTVELKINLIRAARDGVVHAEARALHRGRTTSVWETCLTDDAGSLIAVALSTHMILETRPAAGAASA